MKNILVLLYFFLLFFQLSAQEDAKLIAILKKFKAGEMSTAIQEMHKYLEKNNTPENWDLYVKMYAARAEYVLDLPDKEGENAKMYVIELLNACRESMQKSRGLYASMYLRNYLVDYNPDTNLNTQAKEKFAKAEIFFRDEKYGQAKNYYRHAIAIQPKYYKALLYLGDAFYQLEQQDSAIYFYSQAANMYPNLMEPHKYLTDAYFKAAKYENAMQECIAGIGVYPDMSMFDKMEDISRKQGKIHSLHWMPRGCEPNSYRVDNQEHATTSAWKTYRSAKADIAEKCDGNGLIIHSTSLTSSRYSEVYAWEKMLKERNLPKEFDFAKKMQKEGFLDCYVFISLFHHDIYQQYRHFSENNAAKIKKYVEKYLIE